ncbi:MAG: YdcF family protein [Acidimicrobiales bacterium]
MRAGRRARPYFGGMVAGRATKKTKRRGRRATALVLVLVLLWVALSAKLFVWPAHDPVAGAHADAVVVLNFPGRRWQVAQELARERAAPVMLVSVASVEWNCPLTSFPGVRLECFRPDPFSTMGEARYAADQARQHGWHSLIFVTSLAQATRARVRVKRCFNGSVQVVVEPRPSLPALAYDVVYEWGALAKALIWQRAC